MIRALYTAASGMNAQQANIDNVAHNLANVNTTGFKKSRVEFEDLVYQEIRVAGSSASATTEAPVGLEIGLGTRAVATARNFSAGNLRSTSAPLDLAIEGDGFFKVSLPDGTTGYTRAGSFHMDAQGLLVTAEGYGLEPQITVPSNTTSLSISKDGIVSATVAGQSAAQQLGTIEIATFSNAAGLRPKGGNIFIPTSASGEAESGAPGTDARGTLQQGFLEDSNVSVVEEMVNMILGQRAYEANSRVIKAADEMLSQVNFPSRAPRRAGAGRTGRRHVCARPCGGGCAGSVSGRRHSRGGDRARGKRCLGHYQVNRHGSRGLERARSAARSVRTSGPADPLHADYRRRPRHPGDGGHRSGGHAYGGEERNRPRPRH